MKSSRISSIWQKYAILVLSLLVAALSPVYAIQPTSGASFAQISFTGAKAQQEYSPYGQVSIDYAMLYGGGYINVERYENGKAAGWVVQNLPVVNSAGQPAAATRFELGGSGRQYSFAAYVDFSPARLPDDSSLKRQVPLTYLLSQIVLPADNNPNAFEDVVCHKDDAKFWAGQQSVVSILVRLGGFNFGEGTGWIVKGKDPNKILLITASHNFTDNQGKDTSVTINYQKTTCGGQQMEDFWVGEVDEVLERNGKLDFLIVSLKDAPKGKTYPPAVQPLIKDIKQNDLVMIPQHPGEKFATKQGGYYYDIANQKRCYISPTPAMNALAGQVDAKCGAAKGTSGSPLLDAAETKGDNTPYAIGLVIGCRLNPDRTCKPLSAVAYDMSNICTYDAGPNGKKLLDCKKAGD
jgi:hypothetical protein